MKDTICNHYQASCRVQFNPSNIYTHTYTHTACLPMLVCTLLLSLQDIVERFQLLLVLCFVVVEDISNSGTWWPAPNTMLECGRIFLWEVGAAHQAYLCVVRACSPIAEWSCPMHCY